MSGLFYCIHYSIVITPYSLLSYCGIGCQSSDIHHAYHYLNITQSILVNNYPLLSRSVQYASKMSGSHLWWANSAEVLYFKHNLGHALSLRCFPCIKIWIQWNNDIKENDIINTNRVLVLITIWKKLLMIIIIISALMIVMIAVTDIWIIKAK